MDFLTGLLTLLDRLLGLRYLPRASLELCWCRAPIFVPGLPTRQWRGIEVKVTAGRSREVCVTRAEWQVRTPDGWRRLAPATLPVNRDWVVPANREDLKKVGGKTVAKVLPSPAAEIRLRLHQPHGTLDSRPLGVEAADLRRERMVP